MPISDVIYKDILIKTFLIANTMFLWKEHGCVLI